MFLKKAVFTAFYVALGAAAAHAQKMGHKGKVTRVVIDEFNAMTLPMAPVEVVESGAVVYTELDGKYVWSFLRGATRSRSSSPATKSRRCPSP